LLDRERNCHNPVKNSTIELTFPPAFFARYFSKTAFFNTKRLVPSRQIAVAVLLSLKSKPNSPKDSPDSSLAISLTPTPKTFYSPSLLLSPTATA